jgi:hypothetical protein
MALANSPRARFTSPWRGEVGRAAAGRGDREANSLSHPTPPAFAHGAQAVDPPPPGEGEGRERGEMKKESAERERVLRGEVNESGYFACTLPRPNASSGTVTVCCAWPTRTTRPLRSLGNASKI